MSSADRAYRRFCRTGDPAALAAVYDATAERLLRAALHLAPSPSTAEDLVQSTFVVAIERARDFEPARPVLPWLLGILAHQARNAQRRERRAPVEERRAEPPACDPADAAADRELCNALDRALDTLPALYRPVLVLRLRHGLEPAAIAHALGRAPATVRSQLARGLEHLRRALPLATAALVAVVPERGLAAVRAAVLAHAAAVAPVALPAAAVTASAFGGLLVSNKVIVSVAAAVVLGALAWLAVRSADAPPPAVLENVTAAEPEGTRAEVAGGAAVADEPTPVVRETVTAPPGAEPATGGETAPATGTLVVVVTFAQDRAPAAGVLVAVELDASGMLEWGPRREARADAEGRARFESLRPGPVVVRASLGGERPAEIVAGEESEVRLAIPRGFAVAGEVVDAVGNAIQGAEIWLSDAWRSTRGAVVARSDRAGAFRIEPVTAHRYVGAAAAGYLPSLLYSAQGDPGAVVRVRIALSSGSLGRVRGRVVDGDGQAVAGARVLVGAERSTERQRGSDGSWVPSAPPREGATDGEGRYEVVGVVAGRRAVAVRADGFGTARAEAEVVADATALCDVTLQPAAVITGRVLDADGAPVVGAAVYCGADRFGGASARSGEGGAFRLDGLAAGRVEVQARLGTLRGVTAVEVAAGAEHAVDVRLAPQDGVPDGALAARGIVVDAAGVPLPRWRVVVTQAEGGASGTRELGSTDAEGRFAVAVPWPLVNIAANAPAQWAAFPPVFATGVRSDGGNEVTLRVPAPLETTGGIRGRVVDRAGLPRRARIEVWHAKLQLYCAAENDADTGAFSIDYVQAGPNRVNVQCADDPWLPIGEREVTAGRVLDLGDLVTAPSGRIAGVVTLAGREPPPEMKIVVLRGGSEAGVIRYAGGRFESSPLAVAADYLLVASADRVQTLLRTAAVEAGGTTDLTLALEPGALRELRVELPDGTPPIAYCNVSIRDAASGDQVWYGSAGPQRPHVVRASLRPGEFRVVAHGPRGELGQWPLRVDSLADAEAVVLRVP